MRMYLQLLSLKQVSQLTDMHTATFQLAFQLAFRLAFQLAFHLYLSLLTSIVAYRVIG